jgi:hypothetical protein
MTIPACIERKDARPEYLEGRIPTGLYRVIQTRPSRYSISIYGYSDGQEQLLLSIQKGRTWETAEFEAAQFLVSLLWVPETRKPPLQYYRITAGSKSGSRLLGAVQAYSYNHAIYLARTNPGRYTSAEVFTPFEGLTIEERCAVLAFEVEETRLEPERCNICGKEMSGYCPKWARGRSYCGCRTGPAHVWTW